MPPRLAVFVFFTWLITLSVSLPMKNARLLLRFQSSNLEPAWHHQRFRLIGLDCADRGKTCPSNKWFRLLGLSCNVVQNNPSFLVSFSLLFYLIKSSCYLLSMWLCCSPFIIYILITLSSLPPNRPFSPPSTGRQRITTACPRNQREKTNYY